jgi:RNA polymerase sigma-70 factor, ECF subfamily
MALRISTWNSSDRAALWCAGGSSDGMADDIREELVALLPRLRRFAYAQTGSRETGDEIVQAACVRALERLDQFTPGTRLDSWMFRIIQTIWIDRLRVARRRPHADLGTAQVLSFDARIHERTEARADLTVVRSVIGELPDEQRAVLALVAIDGRTYQEAADTLGIPIGTVMSRLSRARRRLMDALQSPARRDSDKRDVGR